MGRKKPQAKTASKAPFRIIAAAFFLTEIAYVSGAASPFRQPKETVALAGISIAMALAVVSAARLGTFALPRGRLVWVLAGLPVLQMASMLWSASPLRALESSLLTTTWVVGILWISTLSDAHRRKLAVVAGIGAAASSFVMILQLSGVKVFDFAAPFTTKRLSLTGLSGNPADLAMATVLTLPLLLVWYDTIRPRWLGKFLIVVLSLACLLTQTLTGIASLLLLFVVWLVQQRSRRLFVAALGVGTVIVIAALTAGLGDRLQRESTRIRQGDWYSLLSARGDGWTAAEEMIRTRPIVGIGAANYTYLFYPSRLSWLDRNNAIGKRNEMASHFEWAHCDPLQHTAELGIFGLVWMSALLWVLFGMRSRAGPLLPLAGAAVAPFLLLHYPTHLAVGMVPISLCLSHLIARDRDAQPVTWRSARLPVAVVLIVVAVASTAWQVRRLAIDVWMGGLELRIMLSDGTPAETRAQIGAWIESQVLPRIDRLPQHTPALWRTVGRARLIRGELAGAEKAFRTALSGWPHEDAEFYLGVSLAAQGRRNEGLHHLARVCRSNPKLMNLLADEDLRRSVEEIVETHKGQ